MKYDKLVRDKIPNIIHESGKDCISFPAKEFEVINYLNKKVYEELKEFEENPCIEEAADILEILDAYFKKSIGFSYNSSTIKKAKRKKKKKVGAFKKNYILHEVSD